MPPSQAPATLEMRTRLHPSWLPLSLLALGLVARLAWAYSVFLNPDEALHYLLSVQPSLALTYQATLLTAHPPLLIVLLHYWSLLGTSEFVLRLPSVLAGTAFCWIMFLWLERVTDHATALIGLSLLLFSPALIYLSAEIRQYSLLLFFMACSLYFLDRAIGERSSRMVLLSALALYLALLTHYSALIFALTIGIYALVRFRSSRTQARLIGVWGVTQLGALGLVAFLLKSHVLKMRARGMSQALADTYLRGAVFHAGQDRVLPFIVKANIRLFHYMFSQGAVGVLGLLVYIAGIGFLLADKGPAQDSGRPSSRQLGLLLVLPLAINCGAALAGLYPSRWHTSQFVSGGLCDVWSGGCPEPLENPSQVAEDSRHHDNSCYLQFLRHARWSLHEAAKPEKGVYAASDGVPESFRPQRFFDPYRWRRKPSA